ncbi:MAG: hypothetical protein RBS55_09780 [Bacteroidales bacterium]|jgi:hypothetical protein|nr:hypothetical protein [Bacteroidales bacterium]
MMDIILTGEIDLKIDNGDFAAAGPVAQHQHLLLLATPGDFMQSPDKGVGIRNYLSDERDDMVTEIRSQFEKDGMRVDSLRIHESKIEIEARYL